MKQRLSSPYNPPRDPYTGSMNPYQWDLEATPDWVLHGDDVLQEEKKQVNGLSNFTNFFREFIASFGPVGRALSSILEIPANQLNARQVELNNYEKRFEARRADWYNSPEQQLIRLRRAGLNPFMQSYVKSYPSTVPDPEPFLQSVPHYQPESMAGLMNALTNYNMAPYRMHNLDSLTAINEFKGQYLYPQLFEANGYANAIASLQVAWEEKNYTYERLLKQQLLETQFGLSLANIGEKIIELRPQQDNNYVMIDPVNCRIWIQDETGKKVDTTNWKLSDYPIAYQKAWNEIYRQQDLTNANLQRILADANTTSALGALYNANRLKVEQYTTEFEKYGTWPDSDAYLRAAAGAIPWEYINKMQANKLGWSAANAAVGLGADASKIALSKGLGSYFGKKAIPETFKLPKGARPYINADFNSYSSPYNYNFIY